MNRTEKKVVGIQSWKNQCWFCAKCGYRPKLLLKRKRWGVHTPFHPPKAWGYASLYNATNFQDEEVARIVCDRLNAENTDNQWKVVRFEEVITQKMKVLYTPKKERANVKGK